MSVNNKKEQINAKREFKVADIEELDSTQSQMLQIVDRLSSNIKSRDWLKAIMDLDELNKSVGRSWETNG